MQKCNGCTLCCKLLPTEEVGSMRNKWCDMCSPGVGCVKYKDRPSSCKRFNCAWLQMDDAAIELRPDECKVVFQKINDRIMMGVLDPHSQLKTIVKKQIGSFLNEGYSVLLVKADWKEKPSIYLAKNHTAKEVWDAVMNKEKTIVEETEKTKEKEEEVDSTKLHGRSQ